VFLHSAEKMSSAFPGSVVLAQVGVGVSNLFFSAMRNNIINANSDKPSTLQV
jgi:hypothetical protein